MQTLEYRVVCEHCREMTYHEIRYHSDYEFIGRVLVCQDCGEMILQPLGPRDRVHGLLSRLWHMWLMDIREKPEPNNYAKRRLVRAKKALSKRSVYASLRSPAPLEVPQWIRTGLV